MAICIVVDCPGHGSFLESLTHGQRQLLTEVQQMRVDIRARLGRIHTNQEKTMTDIDAVLGAFGQLQADVTRALADLQADAQQIKDLLAAQGGVPADVQAKLDSLGQGLADLDAAVNAADPAPAAEPTPEPAPEPTP